MARSTEGTSSMTEARGENSIPMPSSLTINMAIRTRGLRTMVRVRSRRQMSSEGQVIKHNQVRARIQQQSIMQDDSSRQRDAKAVHPPARESSYSSYDSDEEQEPSAGRAGFDERFSKPPPQHEGEASSKKNERSTYQPQVSTDPNRKGSFPSKGDQSSNVSRKEGDQPATKDELSKGEDRQLRRRERRQEREPRDQLRQQKIIASHEQRGQRRRQFHKDGPAYNQSGPRPHGQSGPRPHGQSGPRPFNKEYRKERVDHQFEKHSEEGRSLARDCEDPDRMPLGEAPKEPHQESKDESQRFEHRNHRRMGGKSQEQEEQRPFPRREAGSRRNVEQESGYRPKNRPRQYNEQEQLALNDAELQLQMNEGKIFYEPQGLYLDEDAARPMREEYYEKCQPMTANYLQLSQYLHDTFEHARRRENFFTWVDRHPDRTIRCVYTNAVLVDGEGNRLVDLNEEHSFPQSFQRGARSGTGRDMHAIFSVSKKANYARGNLPFADEGHVLRETESGTIIAQGKWRFFRPHNNQGALARAALYILVCYRGCANEMYFPRECLLWAIKHSTDEVTDWERHRNNVLHQLQGNRNPFIDFPGLASRLDFEGAWQPPQPYYNGFK